MREALLQRACLSRPDGAVPYISNFQHEVKEIACFFFFFRTTRKREQQRAHVRWGQLLYYKTEERGKGLRMCEMQQQFKHKS